MKCTLSAISFLAGLGSKYAGLESEPELSDLMNEVASKVSSKWKDISIQLGLTLNDQKHFMELTLGDPNSVSLLYSLSGRVEQPGHIQVVYCDSSTRVTSS